MTRIVVDKLPSKPEDCPFHLSGECQITTHLGCIFEICDNKCPHLIGFKELIDAYVTKEEKP